MLRFKQIAFILMGIVLFFTSCSGLGKGQPETQHYNLEYPSPQSGHLRPLPLVIKMEPFSASPLYNTSRILYRDQSFNLKAYAYHSWRSSPADLVQHFLLRDLRASGLYKAVLPYTSRLAAAYALEGSVEEFLEWDGEQGWEAVLSLSITLVKRGEKDSRKGVMMQKHYQTREPCDRKNPLAVAEAMSRAMARTSQQIINDLHSHLKDEP